MKLIFETSLFFCPVIDTERQLNLDGDSDGYVLTLGLFVDFCIFIIS